MHRLIVTSATYRQASIQRPGLAEHDPRNLLLGRQNRLRLDAEIVRDAALSASGRLQDLFGGPSVYPPQPDGVYAFTQVTKSWPTETGPNRYRRTLYTHFYRSAPYPFFTTFDSPDFQAVCTRRIRSNTPLQALALANDGYFIELAQGLAERLLQDVAGDSASAFEDRLLGLGELTLSRPWSSTEADILRRTYVQAQADLAQDPAACESLTTAGLRQSTPPPDAAAWVLLARAILNTDNFITRE
jgi:hypothetical protein